MTWAVVYWRGVPRTITNRDMRWGDLPTDGVLWVDVTRDGYRHRLSGHDNYWVHGDAFGVFNDPENAAWYGGAQATAWRWTGSGSESIDPVVPRHARVLRGVLVPDDVARELGLLGPTDSLPARPG